MVHGRHGGGLYASIYSWLAVLVNFNALIPIPSVCVTYCINMGVYNPHVDLKVAF